MTIFQRVTATAVLIATILPLSAAAETRRPRRTDLERLAAETAASMSADAILDAMNRERAARGLRPLRSNRTLSLAAHDRVEDMFTERYFDHVAPDGTDPFVWAARRGYRYRTIGENLATGYRTSARVVDGWMRSPGHRANILASGYEEVGIAIADGSPIRGYGGPLVVAMYGAR